MKKIYIYKVLIIFCCSCSITNPSNWEWRGEWAKLEKEKIPLDGLKKLIAIIESDHPEFKEAPTKVVYQFKDLNLDTSEHFTKLIAVENSNVYLSIIYPSSKDKILEKIQGREASKFQKRLSNLSEKYYSRDFLMSGSVETIFAVFSNDELTYYFESIGYGGHIQTKKDVAYDCKKLVDLILRL